MKAQASRIQDLFSAYSISPSSDLRDQLVRLHIGLVRKVTYQTCRRLPGRAEHLEEIAIQGLIRAIDAYRPSRLQSFHHFAISCIRQELQVQTQAGLGSTASLGPLVAGETRLCS